ncbi:preprotein translocase subunit YidC [Lacticaseibacillus sharpeae JCM 1186 = DSM 20505]|uniref:Membrane protein insertase YidC n=1 Tax=Lacticaseibacillus sharpeae JCM 1186 = DSM 20505 TaxID=1291052 RepID=A0A0R1ZKS3_9LACO|nr:preprotein translocase subunit YidC [Lacticaseibacillus sharpeae JCM 1186 = DSM 20505]
MSKQAKRILAVVAMALVAVTLAGCSTSAVDANSTGIWDRYVIYNAAQFIKWLSGFFGGSYGMGIILFTIIIRIVIFPLSAISMKNMTKQSEIAPKLKALQQQYKSKDQETQEKLMKETRKLYADEDVHPMMSFLPVLVQMPFLFALYQAIYRTDSLKAGTFLWMQLGKPDPLYITMILAAIFTGLTSYMSMLAQPERNSMSMIMTFGMPIFIFVMALALPSAVTIYWVVTNAFSLVQQLLLQNPFKLRREREAKAQAERDREKALRKAKKRALGKR